MKQVRIQMNSIKRRNGQSMQAIYNELFKVIPNKGHVRPSFDKRRFNRRMAEHVPNQSNTSLLLVKDF